jgi:hypothetical protein
MWQGIFGDTWSQQGTKGEETCEAAARGKSSYLYLITSHPRRMPVVCLAAMISR